MRRFVTAEVDRERDIRLSNVQHGRAGARRYVYELRWILTSSGRGQDRFHALRQLTCHDLERWFHE